MLFRSRFREVHSAGTQIRGLAGYDTLRPARACQGYLHRSPRQEQRKAQTGRPHLLRPCGLCPRGRTVETGNGMTKAMPFLQKAILLSYDPRRFLQRLLIILFLFLSGQFVCLIVYQLVVKTVQKQ